MVREDTRTTTNKGEGQQIIAIRQEGDGAEYDVRGGERRLLSGGGARSLGAVGRGRGKIPMRFPRVELFQLSPLVDLHNQRQLHRHVVWILS